MSFNRVSASNFKGLRKYRTLLEESGGYIAGGAFKDIFLGNKPRDLDLFFETPAAFGSAIESYSWSGNLVYENDNAVCLDLKFGSNVEFIRAQYGDIESMLTRFDFTIAKFGLYFDENEGLQAVYHKDFFEHLNQRKLVIDSELPFPLSTFERTLKYTRYGFAICQGSKEQLVEAIRNSPSEAVPQNFYVGID